MVNPVCHEVCSWRRPSEHSHWQLLETGGHRVSQWSDVQGLMTIVTDID
jgi:hypothetical protein